MNRDQRADWGPMGTLWIRDDEGLAFCLSGGNGKESRGKVLEMTQVSCL